MPRQVITAQHRDAFQAIKRTHEQAWSIPHILKEPIDQQNKLSAEAWRILEVQSRKKLRAAFNAQGENKPNARELRDLSIAAATCQTKAYPESAHLGMNAHVPAMLLKQIADTMLKGTPQPIDITPSILNENT